MTKALIIIAAACLVLAACGSGTKPATSGGPNHIFTAPTTTMIASPRTGATIRCTSHGVSAGAKVPAPGHGVTGIADGMSSSATLQLTRKSDGSLVVSCRR